MTIIILLITILIILLIIYYTSLAVCFASWDEWYNGYFISRKRFLLALIPFYFWIHLAIIKWHRIKDYEY